MGKCCCTRSRTAPPKSRVAPSQRCSRQSCDLGVLLMLCLSSCLEAVSGQVTLPRHGTFSHERCIETWEANTHLHDVKTYARRLASHHPAAHQHHSLVNYPEEVRCRVTLCHLCLQSLGVPSHWGPLLCCAQVQRIFSQQLSLPEAVLERAVGNRGDSGRLRRLFEKLRAGGCQSPTLLGWLPLQLPVPTQPRNDLHVLTQGSPSMWWRWGAASPVGWSPPAPSSSGKCECSAGSTQRTPMPGAPLGMP